MSSYLYYKILFSYPLLGIIYIIQCYKIDIKELSSREKQNRANKKIKSLMIKSIVGNPFQRFLTCNCIYGSYFLCFLQIPYFKVKPTKNFINPKSRAKSRLLCLLLDYMCFMDVKKILTEIH